MGDEQRLLLFINALVIAVFSLLVFAAIRDSVANPHYACYARLASCARSHSGH
jgi:hypothetical protein